MGTLECYHSVPITVSYPFTIAKIVMLDSARPYQLLSVFVILLGAASLIRADDEQYQLGPDSQRQAGVPRGIVTENVWKSQIFPGTIRRYWVYCPAQYKPEEK